MNAALTVNHLRAWSALALAPLVALGLLTMSTPASAQSNAAAAEALFDEGRALMAKKRYDEACAKFAASHETDPSVGALLNLCDCREKNGQFASAWGAYSEAASLARQTGDRRRAQFAEGRAAAIKPKLSYLTIEVADDQKLPGLTLRRDGEPVAEALWNQKVPVDPGTYTIRVEAPGHEAREFKVEVGAAKEERAVVPELERRVETDLEPPTGDGSGSDAVPPGGDGGSLGGGSPVRGSGGMPMGRKVAIGLGAAGAVGVIAGSVFGLQASSKWDDAKANCVNGDLNNCTPEGVSLADDARSAATLSTVSFIVGVAAVGAGAALWFLTPTDSGSGAEHATRIEPLISPDLVGARVHLRF
ncbi:tetratricopeptide repeat protein [Haliangium sp.]|uniref:tetratricopeptide repeat protein n=1 Tax=Haliangium sp. TaxID=2663208 RepID=UPI003D13FCF2